MRKVVFAINITADGYCSHTDGIADDELLEYFTGAGHNDNEFSSIERSKHVADSNSRSNLAAASLGWV
jgi:hypothetical protein